MLKDVYIRPWWPTNIFPKFDSRAGTIFRDVYIRPWWFQVIMFGQGLKRFNALSSVRNKSSSFLQAYCLC